MAPDRTAHLNGGISSDPYPSEIPHTQAASSSSASTSKKPLSTLSRNQACRTCRSRKVKCDAVRPACAACRKTASAQGRDPNAVLCEYDTEDSLPSKKSAGKSSADAAPAASGTSRPTSSNDLPRQGFGNDDRSTYQSTSSGGNTPAMPPTNSYGGLDWLAANQSGAPATYGSTYGLMPQSSSNLNGTEFGQGMSLLPGGLYGEHPYGPDITLAPCRTEENRIGLPAPRSFEMPRPAYGSQAWSSNGQMSTSQNASPTLGNDLVSQQQSQKQPGPPPMNGTSFNLPDAALPPALFPFDSSNGSTGQSQKNGAASTTNSLPPLHHTRSDPNGLPDNGQQANMPSNTLSDGDFFNLFWPNWPPTLPSPKLVYSLCDTFFSKKWLAEGLIAREKFFKGLVCPPHHPSFPHVSLIHAICAVATKFVAVDAFGLDRETYWQSEATPTDYHAAAAKAHIDSAIIRGEKLLCVAQAIILICFYSYTSARFVEVWLYCGLATRISSPLGLNHIEALIDESKVLGQVDENSVFRKGFSPAACVPTSEEEKQEQAHTFWLAFTCDRLAAACTGWASSMPEEEVSTLLPKPVITPGPILPITDEELEQLSLSSPTFFTSNNRPYINATSLQYKSVVLLGRVCAFLRSAPWPLGADIIRGARSLRAGTLPVIGDIPNFPEFKKLDALIVAFRLSFPKEYKTVLKRDAMGAVEIALVSAHVIPHAATILLHEAFCQTEEDMSMQRCLTSARAILSIIYLLWEVSYDVSMLQPFVTFCWAVAGRTLVRQLAFKQDAQDELGEATLKQEISVILSAMRMFSERNALGVVVTKALQSLLDDPSLCHPRHNGGIAMARFCETSPLNAATSSSNAPSNPMSGTEEQSSVSTLDTGGAAQSPGQMFSNLLWELEQPGAHIGQNENFKKMEIDLRSLIGPSYDQLLSLTPDEQQGSAAFPP